MIQNKKERLFEIFYNNYGSKMTIIKYNSSADVLI